MQARPPRGMRDLHPADTSLLMMMLDKLRGLSRAYGYEFVETPILEQQELFTSKSGEAILEQLYVLQDKSGRQLALKPDITPSLTRYFLQHRQSDARPVKLATTDRVHRYEAPQAGRYREIRQFNVEQFGGEGPACDADLIRHFVQSLWELGLDDVQILVGDRNILTEAISRLTACKSDDIEKLVRILDKADKVSSGALCQEIRSKFSPVDIPDIGPLIEFAYLEGPIPEILAELDRVLPGSESLTYWRELLPLLSVVPGIDSACTMRPGLARGFDYYNGVLMEAIVPSQSLVGAVGGGGRYDDLPVAYGGRPIPCIGFSLGLDRILTLLKHRGVTAGEPQKRIYVGCVVPERLAVAAQVSDALRAAGQRSNWIVELAYQPRNPRRFYDAATKAKVDWLIVMNGNEIEVIGLNTDQPRTRLAYHESVAAEIVALAQFGTG